MQRPSRREGARPSQPGPRGQRGRSLVALLLALFLTLAVGRIIIPPHSHGPVLLATLVYVLLYISFYGVFWWLGGLVSRR